MIALHAAPPVTHDETTYGFISTFMTHVATVTGYGKDRLATIGAVKALLLAAIDSTESASAPAWRALYRVIDDLVDSAIYAHDTRTAYAYLRAFVQENADLADE